MFISFKVNLLIKRTGANYKLQKNFKTDKIMGKNFFLSIIGQSFIQIVFQVSFFYLIILNRVEYCSVPNNNPNPDNSWDVTIQGSVMSILN